MHAEPAAHSAAAPGRPGRPAPAAPRTAGDDTAAACTALMRGGSKSFFAASLLLPARVKGPATALYAFCRVADDAVDLGTQPGTALRELHARLDAVYAGRPASIDADRALAEAVRTCGLPRALLDGLLDGFRWDAEQRRLDSLADVQAYAARVAGTVGALMAWVMGATSATALARACELGVAMQLTNIARDVGEDARNGRLYLPRRWMAAAGIDGDAWLREPRFSPALASVVERLLAEADRLYARAELGIAELPRDCRPAIRAARLVYAEIGAQLRRQGLDSVAQRSVVPLRRKLVLMARATAAAVPGGPPPRGAAPPPLPAIHWLVNAALAARPAASAVPARPRNFRERTHWVIELCERRAAAARGR